MSVKTINQHDSIGASNVSGLFYVLVEQKTLSGVDEVHKKVLAGQLVSGLVAPVYDTTHNYAIGDPCIYEGLFYICNAATSGNFDPSKWTQQYVANISTGHIQDTTIHVTQADKNNWNGKADGSTNAEIEAAWASA